MGSFDSRQQFLLLGLTFYIFTYAVYGFQQAEVHDIER